MPLAETTQLILRRYDQKIKQAEERLAELRSAGRAAEEIEGLLKDLSLWRGRKLAFEMKIKELDDTRAIAAEHRHQAREVLAEIERLRARREARQAKRSRWYHRDLPPSGLPRVG